MSKFFMLINRVIVFGEVQLFLVLQTADISYKSSRRPPKPPFATATPGQPHNQQPQDKIRAMEKSDKQQIFEESSRVSFFIFT